MPPKAMIGAKRVIVSKKLACKTCRITFHCKEELEEHLSSHEDLLSYYECFHCLKRFGNITERDIHLVTHIGGPQKNFHGCNQCKKTFKLNAHLQTHIQEKHSSPKNKKKPKPVTPSRESYEEIGNKTLDSNKSAEGADQYWCTDCDVQFTGYRSLYSHRQVYHKHLYKCDTCGQGFSSKFKVKHHSLKHLPKMPVRYSNCEICDKTILIKNMDYHKFIVHSEDNRRFNCDICGYKFKLQFHLFRHLDAHKRKVSKYCKICHRRFIRKTSFEEHIKTCKSSEGALNQQQLTSSSKMQSAVPELNHSMKGVTKLKPKSYENVAKSSRSLVGKAVLPGNVGVKESERKQKYSFRCDLCGKVFKLKSNFDNHKKTHRDFLSFKCSHCDKKFKTKTALKSHSCTDKCNEISKGKKSGGIKSSVAGYTCNICNKYFKSQTSLSSHSKTHRDHLYYKCNVCCDGFSTQTKLKAHLCKSPKNSGISEDDTGAGELTAQDILDQEQADNDTGSYKCFICMKPMHVINSEDNADHTHVMVLVS